MEGREWRPVPFLARGYPRSHDKSLHEASNTYYNDDMIPTPKEGDFEVVPFRSNADDDTVRAEEEDESFGYFWRPTIICAWGYSNQIIQDNGIIGERHNKGIPMLHIWDVKRQYGYGSEEQVKCSWKLEEVTKEECKLEIDGKTVKFSFANNDTTDKFVFQTVDGYEVKYMLHTDAMRLRLEFEIVLSTQDAKLEFSNVHGEIKLEIEPDCKAETIALPSKLQPRKKGKFDRSDTFKFSIIRIVPRNLVTCMKLVAELKGSADSLVVERRIFMYNIPVDQRDYIHFKNGHISLNILWGCCLGENKGVCTGVCTCEPGEFIGFPRPSELGCSSTLEE